MAANSITSQTAQFAIARHAGELSRAFVTAIDTAATVFKCGQVFQNLFQTNDDAFNNGLMRLRGGTTYANISDYVGSTRQFTLTAPGLSGIAVGNTVEFMGFNPTQRSDVFNAVNDAIRESWGDFYREVTVDRSGSPSITLASGTNLYSLPTAVSKLLRIGIQLTTTSGVEWFDPLHIWRVEGEEGALVLRFLPGFTAGGAAVWSSRVRYPNTDSGGTFADAFSGQLLCLHYLSREPEITAESSDIRLPLNYVEWVGAEHYLLMRLAQASDNEKRTLNMLLPQVQQKAQRARAQLKLTKPRMPQTVELDF